MRKLVVSLVLLAVFAGGLTVGVMTPVANAIDIPRCWAYCDGSDLIQCCKFPQHGVLCWVAGPCDF